MSDLVEDVARNWLMSKGYFVLHGPRFKGQGELDFLAVRFEMDRIVERLHVEVHSSANPVTYLGQGQAGKGTDPVEGVQKFIKRKFLRPAAIKAAKRVFGTEDFRRMLILGNVNSQDVVLRACAKARIEVVRVWEVCEDLRQRQAKLSLETTDGRRLAQFIRLARQRRNVPNPRFNR